MNKGARAWFKVGILLILVAFGIAWVVPFLPMPLTLIQLFIFGYAGIGFFLVMLSEHIAKKFERKIP